MSEITWLDYLEEEIKSGLSLHYYRQMRGYTLRFTGKDKNADGKFQVIQGSSGTNGDNKLFDDFKDAYDWLFNGKPPLKKRY